MEGMLCGLNQLLMAFSAGLRHEVRMPRLGNQGTMGHFFFRCGGIPPVTDRTGELMGLIQFHNGVAGQAPIRNNGFVCLIDHRSIADVFRHLAVVGPKEQKTKNDGCGGKKTLHNLDTVA